MLELHDSTHASRAQNFPVRGNTHQQNANTKVGRDTDTTLALGCHFDLKIAWYQASTQVSGKLGIACKHNACTELHRDTGTSLESGFDFGQAMIRKQASEQA